MTINTKRPKVPHMRIIPTHDSQFTLWPVVFELQSILSYTEFRVFELWAISSYTE